MPRHPTFHLGTVTLLVSAAVLVAGCQGLPARGGASGQVAVGGRGGAVAIAFSERDRQLIAQYYANGGAYQGKPRRMPPGLAKRDRLPPGLDKRLQKNDPLPPGLQSQGLPGDLEQRLTPLPAGYLRMVVGGDIVLSNTRTRVVVDILHDAAPY